MHDLIKHPSHYVSGRKYEPLDIIEDWGLTRHHYLACALKYIARCDRKYDGLLDLEKAVFYLTREITRRKEKANG